MCACIQGQYIQCTVNTIIITHSPPPGGSGCVTMTAPTLGSTPYPGYWLAQEAAGAYPDRVCY